MRKRQRNNTHGWAAAPSQATEVLLLGQWLATELAATIRGSKPATILTLVDTPFQDTLSLWREHGENLVTDTTISYITMHWSDTRETILFFRPDVLHNCLADSRHKAFLAKLGYPVEKGPCACLELLQRRFQLCCPHEIGIFLGIPLKDVWGFMGVVDLPLTCRGDWCIYGSPGESLRVMEHFAADRSFVSCLFSHGVSPRQILCAQFAAEGQTA